MFSGVVSISAIPLSSTLWLREQSRVPSLRLPIQPCEFSFPYTHRLILLLYRYTGSPALDCLSSATCRPCYPGRYFRLIPFSKPEVFGLPHLSTGSASPEIIVTRLLIGSLSLRPAALPIGHLRPLIALTPLP